MLKLKMGLKIQVTEEERNIIERGSENGEFDAIFPDGVPFDLLETKSILQEQYESHRM